MFIFCERTCFFTACASADTQRLEINKCRIVFLFLYLSQNLSRIALVAAFPVGKRYIYAEKQL